ncbi:MAG: nitrite reductase/ring-hydroxylating ferredoxin subunit [Phenylobacterium sp.]|jgi:nitrite reductase/ring-hydroxylating ferredoxin subunit
MYHMGVFYSCKVRFVLGEKAMTKLLNDYQQQAMASLQQASALPFAVYHDPAVYQLEADKIFRHDWVFVCAEQAMAKPGDYYAFSLAGEAIVLIRAQDGQLRALSNNCRHRGTPLLDEGFGQVDKHISCPYHAWAYDHTGAMEIIIYLRCISRH